MADLEVVNSDTTKKIDFLKRLGINIPPSLKTITPGARLKLLNDIIQEFSFTIPFQNVSLMSQSASKRRLPSLEELEDDVVTGKGGLCYSNNSYFKLCLEAVGFNVGHVAASVSSPHSHIITRVDNVVRDGDCYVVEVGCGYPSFTAIDMDFESESPVFKESFCTYKLVKTSKEAGGYPVYERWQKVVGSRPIAPHDFRDEDKSWFRFYDFTLEPRPLGFFTPFISPLYIESAGVGPFHTNFRLSVFPGGMALTLNSSFTIEGDEKRRKLILARETANGVVKEEYLVNNESEFQQFVDLVKGSFIVLQDFVETALNNFRNLEA